MRKNLGDYSWAEITKSFRKNKKFSFSHAGIVEKLDSMLKNRPQLEFDYSSTMKGSIPGCFIIDEITFSSLYCMGNAIQIYVNSGFVPQTDYNYIQVTMKFTKERHTIAKACMKKCVEIIIDEDMEEIKL